MIHSIWVYGKRSTAISSYTTHARVYLLNSLYKHKIGMLCVHISAKDAIRDVGRSVMPQTRYQLSLVSKSSFKANTIGYSNLLHEGKRSSL